MTLGDVNNDSDDGTRYSGIGVHGSYFQGCQWFAWKFQYGLWGQSSQDNFTYVNKFVEKTVKKGHLEDIQSIFALPLGALSPNEVDNTTHKANNNSTSGKVQNVEYLSKSSWFYQFDDYANVKNNKLYCYPYSFLRISNNSGSYNDYKIENFGIFDEEVPDNIYFSFQGIVCESYSGAIIPLYYEGIQNNLDQSVNLAKFPTFSWSGDSFTNWLTQNGLNLAVNGALSIASSGASIGTGIATGNAVAIGGGSLSLAGNIAGIFNSLRNASFHSNTARGNVNSGDRNFIFNNNRLKYIRMRAKKEYLEKIDNYFSRFGYKIIDTKIPNITGRQNWNYVEIGSSEEIGNGDVPSIYLDEINSAFRRGVTIWHNHNNIGNFNLNNGII